MEYKIIEKGYCIDLHRISENYFREEQYCHAKSRGKAKSILYNEIKYEGWCLSRLYEEFPFGLTEVTFLNLPIKRYPPYDLVEFEGVDIVRSKIWQILKSRERDNELQSILDDKNTTHCYIRKGSYYKPNSCGYTDMRQRAGVYTKEDAVSHAKMCDELTLIPIDNKDHNKIINDEINDLKTRLIK